MLVDLTIVLFVSIVGNAICFEIVVFAVVTLFAASFGMEFKSLGNMKLFLPMIPFPKICVCDNVDEFNGESFGIVLFSLFGCGGGVGATGRIFVEFLRGNAGVWGIGVLCELCVLGVLCVLCGLCVGPADFNALFDGNVATLEVILVRLGTAGGRNGKGGGVRC